MYVISGIYLGRERRKNKQEITDAFRAQIDDKFAALNMLDCDIDTITNPIKKVCLSSAEHILGRERNKNK
ncbi:hypothetical protein DPMN_041348 [Dreissena polymorpha]|uniref:Uncharacterized protein n=1 Tax=Dreissena polymorpha TaxID=45954 RepID=A0A9D4CX25_DREPO|nr:hypothetical protein DPMN_041348 [Dreissena polymorpha]